MQAVDRNSDRNKPFEPNETMRSQDLLIGDHRQGWLAVEQAHEMIERRRGTSYREFAGCGYWTHDAEPAVVTVAVDSLLGEAGRSTPPVDAERMEVAQ